MNSGNSPTGLATGPRLGPEQIRFERTAGDLVRAILADGTRHEPVDFERRLRTHAPANAITRRKNHTLHHGIPFVGTPHPRNRWWNRVSPTATSKGVKGAAVPDCRAVMC